MLRTAVEHYERQGAITMKALAEARRRSWRDARSVAQIIATYQLAAAQDAIDSIDPMLAEQGLEAPPAGLVQASAFAGTASDGRPLVTLLEQATSPQTLGLMVVSQVQDMGRAASGVSIASRPKVGYVRMVSPGACSRCVILAGKFYRYNTGFLRHPRCSCRHIPSVENVAGDLTTDPNLYFDSLSALEQDRTFGKAGAEVIRQGADIGQVVNARRVTAGMRVAGEPAIRRDIRGNLFTTEGTTRRARAAQQQAGLRVNGPVQQRLMPETILKRAKDREDAQRLLRLYGYISDAPAAARGRAIFAQAGRNEKVAAARARRAARREVSPPRSAGAARGGPPSRPGPVASGGMDDEIAAAAARLSEAATTAEPAATRLVESIAGTTNGLRARTDTVFKTDASLREKVRRLTYGKPARLPKAEARVNDALRYTLVYDESRYWNAVTNVNLDLGSLGHQVVAGADGWRRTGYKGINLTVRSPTGSLFEVQVHTPASLAMAERTHLLYEQQRLLPRNSDEWQALEREQNDLWSQVTRPPDVPEID